MSLFKLAALALELTSGVIILGILLYVLSLTMAIFPVPAGSPFDVSGEILTGVAIILAVVGVGDIFLIYTTLKSDDLGRAGGRY